MQASAAPLVPQKTGPAPPVRFGVQPGVKPLAPQPTGRANLSKASEYTQRCGMMHAISDLGSSSSEPLWLLKPRGMDVEGTYAGDVDCVYIMIPSLRLPSIYRRSCGEHAASSGQGFM
jgi:hypothetical protein